ncbi:MAG TPA: cytochrome ubiquinol oxidase subunit I, partial [Nitrospiria bacterium]|nr:cytochrome ubiquinol oxidase subunit I [Nitrospiria bacterium]
MYNSTGNRSPRASKRPFRFPVFIVSTFFVLFFILTVFPIHPGFPQIRSSTVRASFEPSSIEPTNDVSYKVKGIPSGPAATKLRYPEDYGTYGQFQSRTIVWVLAQQHNYLGSFVLGVLFLISVLEVRGMLIRDREATQQHDRVAYELLGIVLLALSIASITGGILLFGLLSLYPGLMRYLASILGPFFAMYGFLFLSISLTAYLYYQSWNRMERGNAKWVHAAIGVLANFFGILLMALANSWITFMMSPSGVDEHGRFLGSYWRVLHTPLWVSYSVHRFFVCILFGSAVVAGYAAYRAMTAKSQDEK